MSYSIENRATWEEWERALRPPRFTSTGTKRIEDEVRWWSEIVEGFPRSFWQATWALHRPLQLAAALAGFPLEGVQVTRAIEEVWRALDRKPPRMTVAWHTGPKGSAHVIYTCSWEELEEPLSFMRAPAVAGDAIGGLLSHSECVYPDAWCQLQGSYAPKGVLAESGTAEHAAAWSLRPGFLDPGGPKNRELRGVREAIGGAA